MPNYRVTFLDGTTIDRQAANADLAKTGAKLEAQQKSGATMRSDPRVKVAHVVNMDEEAGPTDPRNFPGAGAGRAPGGR